MNNLNTVLLEGTLTRDPQREDKTAEFSMCKLAVANNRYYVDKKKEWVKDSSYFYVYVFGPVAEACLRFLTKGRGIRVVGRLKQHSWKGLDGTWRERIYIIAEHIEFQPPRKTDDTPPVESRRNGPPDTKADTTSLEALENASKVEPEPIPEQELQSGEPVSPTVLDDGGAHGSDTEEEEDDPF